MFFKVFNESEKNTSEVIKHFKKIMESTQAVVIGAGAGLSASAGFEYDGETFGRYFFDFEKKYGFHDMRGDFIRLKLLKSNGHFGAGIFISIDIRESLKVYMTICTVLLRIKIIL